jgi:hypothetical protein
LRLWFPWAKLETEKKFKLAIANNTKFKGKNKNENTRGFLS